jgi:NADH-quinone oxidoreductase subunit N
VGAYYYLRVVWYMYFDSADGRASAESRARMRLILLINALAVTALGLLPNALLDICRRLIP